MKEQLKEVLKKLQYYSGYISLYQLTHAPSENRLLIFMLHDVVTPEEQNAHWYNSDNPSTTQLEALIIAAKKRFRIISVEDAMQEIRSNGAVKEKSVAFTFDDGYRSCYELLYPLFLKHQVTATIYLPCDWIDGRLDPWWLGLTNLIDQCELTAENSAEASGLLGDSLGELPLNNTNKAKAIFHERVGNILMRKDDKSRVQLFNELQAILLNGRSFLPRKEEAATWAQIKEMSNHGIKFGAHTCSHPNLSFLDLASAEREITESKRIIEQHLDIETLGFAFPYGYDVAGYRRLRPALEKTGYLYACTSWWGYVDSKSDRFLLGRTGLPLSDSQPVLGRALALEYCSNNWPMPPEMDQWPAQASNWPQSVV